MNAISFYRVARWLYVKRVPILPNIIQAFIFLLFNSYIPYTAKIGKGTRFGYGGIGVVIHARAEIGENCIIAQQVTIGGRSGHENPPRIGSRVYLATGAKILGDIVIGDESVIGANSVVINNVPAKCVVAGVPAKIIKEGIDISYYF